MVKFVARPGLIFDGTMLACFMIDGLLVVTTMPEVIEFIGVYSELTTFI